MESAHGFFLQVPAAFGAELEKESGLSKARKAL